MKAASEADDIDRVRELSDESLSRDLPPGTKLRVYEQLIRSYTKVGNVDQASELFEEVQAQGPTIGMVAALLDGYVSKLRKGDAYALVHRLPALGLTPNLHIYNSLMALHASLRDPEGAEDLLSEMADFDIAPDRVTYTTLMDAYVETGQWREVVRIFEFLVKHHDPRLRPDAAAMNVILKTAITTGVAAQDTLSIFRRALADGLRPNEQTFTHVIHALCVAGLMDLAEEMFALMDRGDRLPFPSSEQVRPGVHVFSAIIYGYLRASNTAKARAWLLEMRERKIQPTSVTYGIIIASFLGRDAMGDLDTAISIAKEFLEGSPLDLNKGSRSVGLDQPYLRGRELLPVFAPIVNALAKRVEPARALEYFRIIVERGVEPPLTLYTALMDAYRKADDWESVEFLWQKVLSKVSGDGVARVPKSQAQALCRPFTILLHALSQAERYDTLLATWMEQAERGFAFDASNWNALGVAAALAGDLDRAWWISERVLCANADLEESIRGVGDPSEEVSGSNETRSRLYDAYEGGYALGTSTIAEYLRRPPTHPALRHMLDRASFRRYRLYWHTSRGLLHLLEDSLASFTIDSPLRHELQAGHPRTMQAIRRRQARQQVRADSSIQMLEWRSRDVGRRTATM
jgi:pentatricopeptide repeat protein